MTDRSPPPLSRNEACEKLSELQKKFSDRGKPSWGEESDVEANHPTFFLVTYGDQKRAFPNHCGRSGLFVPTGVKHAKELNGVIIPSRADAKIRYWGPLLDESVCDVWMQILHICQGKPLGEPVEFEAKAFLTAIGRSAGGSDYTWLYQALFSLARGTITIQTKKYSIGENPTKEPFAEEYACLSEGKSRRTVKKIVHLIMELDIDEETSRYKVSIHPHVAKLFSHEEYSLIDWRKRLAIKKQRGMCKFIQRLIAASDRNRQSFSLQKLAELMMYTSPMRKFKAALSECIRELVDVEIIGAGQFYLKRGVQRVAFIKDTNLERSKSTPDLDEEYWWDGFAREEQAHQGYSSSPLT